MVYEGVAATGTTPPTVLQRLQSERLTGYARYTFPTAVSILLFNEGRLASVLLERGGQRISGLDAVAGTFEQVATQGGRLDVYRLATDLARSLQALLHGELLYQGQELRIIDAKALLAKLRAQQLNGCLRIYTSDRTALIFYKEGVPLGFFHDGSQQIETSATESQRVAGLPGAKLDVFASKDVTLQQLDDLLEVVNVQRIWDVTVARYAEQLARLSQEAEAREREAREARLTKLEEDLRTIASGFIGPMGRSLVDKELSARGGRSALIDEASVRPFLAAIEKGARLLTGATQTEKLVAALRTEIATRLGPQSPVF